MPRPRKTPLPKEASASRLKFAGQLRAERRRQGLTLEDLAERSGLTWSYISQVERGIRNISIDNQDALARGLGVELRDLL
ncbi:helix-turn-helix transcriptional regulator [Deinococcus sp. Arct2-2]|uniref:helix-turn-helix domain-containing protein n=1 Tax=Deinococcus sp. Arct2-2 TaxID=2568653 RepID=UPI0010A33EB8|nr:helix-turn-helix transcriptional regulator [Deinococcus sp. Arct2-2]THF69612.1 helix-turn-helix transcriptional regulator [Deinococcus sp. Arct2-2]